MINVSYERFCFPITLRCNLKCKLCAEHAPYSKRPYHPKFHELTKQLDQLFRLVNHIGKFDITGGEPFLRDDLANILDYLRIHYSSKIDIIRVTTNGTILPSTEFIKAASAWKTRIFVIVDNYAVSHKSSIIYESLQQSDIPCELRNYSTDLHCDGWVDYGDLSLKHSREDAKNLFQKCMVPKLGFFTCMTNGMLFPCARARLLYEHFIADISIDLFDPALTDEGKKARMKSLLGWEVIEACRYCNGLCEDSPRFVPAEQLTIPYKPPQKQIDYKDWKLEDDKVLVYTQTYNNEKTIARTIESVLNQTNQNFTYFICNNGSTDRTGEIIRKYAKKNNNIVYVQCDFNDILGVTIIPSSLFRFIPQYVNFYYTIIDGDDSIESDFLEQALRLSKDNNLDMIVASVNRINAETGQLINQRHPDKDLIVSGRQKADNFINLRPLLLTQWGKLHRWKSYQKYKNIFLYKYSDRIPKWFHTSDAVSILSIFHQCDSVGFLAKPTYNYYISPTSVYHSYFPNRIKSDELTFKIYNDFLDQYPPVDSINRDYCYAIYYSFLEDTLQSIFQASNISTEQKLLDLLSLLQAETTQQLFSKTFDPIFQNLSHRETLIERIQEYLHALPQNFSSSDTYQQVYSVLIKYGA